MFYEEIRTTQAVCSDIKDSLQEQIHYNSNSTGNKYCRLHEGPLNILGVKYQHSLDPLPAVTPSKVDFQSMEDVSGIAKLVYVLVKVHGMYDLLRLDTGRNIKS